MSVLKRGSSAPKPVSLTVADLNSRLTEYEELLHSSQQALREELKAELRAERRKEIEG